MNTISDLAGKAVPNTPRTHRANEDLNDTVYREIYGPSYYYDQFDFEFQGYLGKWGVGWFPPTSEKNKRGVEISRTSWTPALTMSMYKPRDEGERLTECYLLWDSDFRSSDLPAVKALVKLFDVLFDYRFTAKNWSYRYRLTPELVRLFEAALIEFRESPPVVERRERAAERNRLRNM
jgi:hypothetical protein